MVLYALATFSVTVTEYNLYPGDPTNNPPTSIDGFPDIRYTLLGNDHGGQEVDWEVFTTTLVSVVVTDNPTGTVTQDTSQLGYLYDTTYWDAQIYFGDLPPGSYLYQNPFVPSPLPPPAGVLFTPGSDTVNFNHLSDANTLAITNGADLYHSLGGADDVWLPADGTALVPGILWDSSKVFSLGTNNQSSAPGNDASTVHSGPSNDLIDGAYESNAQFGGAANQRGNVVFTSGDTVEFHGGYADYTIRELTGGYLEVKDNSGSDGTDILKDIAWLKFDDDGTTIAAPGRQIESVLKSDALAWLEANKHTGKNHKLIDKQSEALAIIDAGKNLRWAADPASSPGAPHYTITYSIVTDPNKLSSDYTSLLGLSALTPVSGAAVRAIRDIFSNVLPTILPNVTFVEVHENLSADPVAAAHGLGDVGSIRFVGAADIDRVNPDERFDGEAFTPDIPVSSLNLLGDIVLSSTNLTSKNTFTRGHLGYTTLEHEIGHALGLGDVKGKFDSIMDATRHPQAKGYTDVDDWALQALYNAPGKIENVVPGVGSVPPAPMANVTPWGLASFGSIADSHADALPSNMWGLKG